MALAKPKLPVGGLAIGPNDLDSPAGNFQVAENVFHRRDGILEPMPGDEQQDDSWVAPIGIARVFSDWPMRYSFRITKNGGSNTGRLSYGSTPTEYSVARFRPGETQCVYADGRHILSGAQFGVVLDGDTDSAHGEPRRAGMVPPSWFIAGTGVPGVGDYRQPIIPANKVCAYTATLKRKIKDDRFVVSAPAAKVHIGTNVSAQYAEFAVFFQRDLTVAGQTTDLVVDGDIIQIWRTKFFDSVEEINDTYYLVTEHEITSSDVSSWGDNDIVYEDALGAELYVNPGAEGSLKTNMPIPRSSGVETFGGTTFYPNKNSAPIATFTIPGNWGDIALVGTDAGRRARLLGIGSRSFLGDITNGSPDILNVSADGGMGVVIGQLVYHGNLPGGVAQITNVVGAGPYTVTVDKNFSATLVGTSLIADDAFRVIMTDAQGATTTSEWSNMSSPTFFLESLFNLQEAGTGDPMHGLSAVLDRVYEALPPSGSAAVNGASVNLFATQVDVCESFVIQVTNPQNFVLLNTDGAFTWYRDIPSLTDTRRNIVWYSKTNQPEHVAPVQFFPVGAGTVYRLLNVQSCVLAFCSDGIYKIDGQGDIWSIVLVDNAARLVHPDCAVAITTTAFAWLESGLALCTETGTQTISKDAIGPDLQALVKTLYGRTNGPRELWGPAMAIDRLNNEVYLNILHYPTDDTPTYYACYVFNTLTAKFTTCGEDYTAMCYAPSELCVLKGKYDGYLYVDSSIDTDYKIATVLYLPLVDDAGIVKQWNDVNYFFDNVPTGTDGETYDVEALFGGELTSTTNVFEKPQDGAPGNMFALHSLVPRRCGRGTELVLGFRTSTEPSETHPSGGYYFEFKGASVRARVASQVIKR